MKEQPGLQCDDRALWISTAMVVAMARVWMDLNVMSVCTYVCLCMVAAR